MPELRRLALLQGLVEAWPLLLTKSIKPKDSLDIMAFKIREALRISLEINQKLDIEDILDIIFKDFCIGK